MKKLTLVLQALCFVLVFTGFSAKSQQKVPKWQPFDIKFKSNTETSNPFRVSFSADITGPDGTKLVLPGFYDGNKTWKIRFSPTKEGNWSIKTHSSLSKLDNKKAKLVCIQNPDSMAHGSLKVDPEHGRHFIYEDGTRCFPVGYECNWLYALDTGNPQLPTMNPFLDKIVANGFNFILVNAFAYDTRWRLGKTGADDYGPSPLYAWEGTNSNPDHSRFNLTYWQHFDLMMAALNKRGIGAHVYIKVYNKEVNWPKNDSPDDDQYFRWIIARYAAYPNIIWDLAKEANNEKSVTYKTEKLKYIRATDPYHRLLTVHTDIKTFDNGSYDGLVDFRSHQEQSNHLNATMLAQLKQNTWPIFNVESGYEYGPKGPGDKTYSHVDSPEDVAKFFWEIQMGEGYNAYYYTYTAWDVIRTKDTPPGYAYIKNFTDFFIQTDYWTLKASNPLVNKGLCLANPGKEYVVFQYSATPFKLTLAGIAGSLKAKWYQPYSGKYADAGTLSNGAVTLTPPASFDGGPVVLYVGSNNLIEGKSIKENEKATGLNNSTDTSKNIALYPNPVATTMNITIEDLNSIEVYNGEGLRLLKTDKNVIDFTAFKEGTYYLIIENKRGQRFKREVIHKSKIE